MSSSNDGNPQAQIHDLSDQRNRKQRRADEKTSRVIKAYRRARAEENKKLLEASKMGKEFDRKRNIDFSVYNFFMHRYDFTDVQTIRDGMHELYRFMYPYLDRSIEENTFWRDFISKYLGDIEMDEEDKEKMEKYLEINLNPFAEATEALQKIAELAKKRSRMNKKGISIPNLTKTIRHEVDLKE